MGKHDAGELESAYRKKEDFQIRKKGKQAENYFEHVKRKSVF
jgi:hypothetical protein